MLAALRFWQAHQPAAPYVESLDREQAQMIEGIIHDFDGGELSASDIDDLCERINVDDTPRLIVAVDEGIVRMVASDCEALHGIEYALLDFDIEGSDDDRIEVVGTKRDDNPIEAFVTLDSIETIEEGRKAISIGLASLDVASIFEDNKKSEDA